MKSLSRSELQRLLGLDSHDARSYVVEAEHIEGDLRIQHFQCGPAQIPAVSLAPVDASPKAPALLYCHAHGNAYGIGKSEILEGRPALQDPPLAKVIARAGWTVFCADMPGFGARQLQGSESALAKSAHWHGQTLLGQMVNDQLLALDVLIDAVRPSLIATLGISMGGTLAYLVAALRDDIAATAHLCVFADIAPLIGDGAHDLHGPYMTIPGLLRDYDMSSIAALVAPRHQLVATGGADPLTPEGAYSQAIATLANVYSDHPDKLTIIRDMKAGHQETLDMRKAVLSFLAGCAHCAGHSPA
jgi:pimeloyl-ACP methyl ester carboxylesterase